MCMFRGFVAPIWNKRRLRVPWLKYEPGYSIFYKIASAPSDDSDQTAHPCRLIRVYVSPGRRFRSSAACWILPCKESAKTARLHRLI